MSRWPVVALGEIAQQVSRGEAPEPGRIYRQIGVRLWGDGAYGRESIDGARTKYAQLFRAEEGDIVVNKIWARNGSVAIVPSELAGCYGSSEFPMFAPNRSRVEPRWIHWLTKTRWFWTQCDEKSRGTSGQNRIRPERFAEITIPLPPLSEQRRIVARIEELSAKVAVARTVRKETIDEADMMLIAMAHRADLDIAAKTGAGWRCKRLAEVLRLVDDSHKVSPNRRYPNFGIYSFGRGLFHKPAIDGLTTSASSLRRVKKGQFIYSRLFAFEGAYGMVTEEFDGAFVSSEYPTFECDPAQVRAELLAAYFKSEQVWKAVAAGSKGLGDRRQRVQPDRILAHEIWIPPVAWQNRLADVHLKIEALKRHQEETNDEFDALLPAILDRAFKGKL